MKALLNSYLHRLTNLSGTNKSLFMSSLTQDKFIDLHEFDFSTNRPSFEILQDLIAGKKKNVLSKVMDPRDTSSNQLSQRLRKIDRIQEFIFQERGSRDLYLGWPFVQGKFVDGTLARCPLVFVPVTLEQEKGEWHLRKREDVNITLNKSFLLGYAYFNQVTVDEELVEKVLSDFDTEITGFRTELYNLLESSTLEVNFNQENLEDQLKPFKNFRKKELQETEKPGKLKLYPEAVIGIFPQAGSYLVPDYLQLQEQDFSDLEEFFVSKVKSDPEDEGRTKFSDRVLEENTYTPFAIDASQEQALKYIKKGNSVTVQGPPGTGKSQLIANLISDFIARGKSVLLICQKRVALDVVYQRLSEKNLHDFIGLVHDFKNDRKTIFDKVKDQISNIDVYQQKNNRLDAIHLERSFVKASRRIEEISEELEEYKFALFDESECSKSVKELYLTSDPQQPHVDLKPFFSQIDYEQYDQLTFRLKGYWDYTKKFSGENNFWASGKSFANLVTKDFLQIKESVENCVSEFGQFQEDSKKGLHRKLDFDSTVFFQERRELLAKFITNIESEKTYSFFIQLVNENIDEEGEWLAQMEQTVLQCFKGDGIEHSLKSNELGRFQESLEHAIQARKNPWKSLKWRLFSKDRFFITRVLVANNLRSSKKGFQQLIGKIDNRLNYEHNLSIIQSKSWLKDFPRTIDKMAVQNWFFYQRNAFKTYLQFRELRNLVTFVSFKNKDRTKELARLKSLLESIDLFPVKKLLWQKYLTDNQIRSLLIGEIEKDTALKQLDRDFEDLHEYHTLLDGFEQHERRVIDLLQEEYEGSDMMSVFRNSLALAWIDHIEAKYPVLRTVSSMKFDRLIQELDEAIQTKKKYSEEILLMRCRERTYKDLEFNRLSNPITYRDLEHQVTKKRKVWPLRRILGEYEEEMFKLIPCWMGSPESASAIFPMKEMFDLVIFDEASQCFAERAIPALYRGRQVVVAGDSQQLKPFDLYRVRWDGEDEELPELEIDSLLDLASRYLQQCALRGHYRSKLPELLSFSNSHFYDNRLELIPERKIINNRDERAIEFFQVKGIWENNTNRKEAERIVELVKHTQLQDPHATIGIVTFNIQQQSLITELIELETAIRLEKIQVRNIENVQGNEYDFVIFSIGYAPDKKGKLQLRFGSLNMEGGENRLNVAATRAKSKIIVVASIEPSAIKAEHTRNLGPKLLHKFLQYAQQVSNGDFEPILPKPSKSSIEWYLKHRISAEYEPPEQNQRLSMDLTFADMGVQDHQKHIGALLTDDDHFYTAHSIKEVFVYLPNQLSKKNWPNLRLNSRNYWLDKGIAADKLKIFLGGLNS